MKIEAEAKHNFLKHLGISEGDTLIIETEENIETGDILAFMIDKNICVMRIEFSENSFTLYYEKNNEEEPLTLNKKELTISNFMKVLGKVTAVKKKKENMVIKFERQ